MKTSVPPLAARAPDFIAATIILAVEMHDFSDTVILAGCRAIIYRTIVDHDYLGVGKQLHQLRQNQTQARSFIH
jgi:hypothetical protein